MDEEKRREKLKELRQKRQNLVDAPASAGNEPAARLGAGQAGGKGEMLRRLLKKRMGEKGAEGGAGGGQGKLAALLRDKGGAGGGQGGKLAELLRDKGGAGGGGQAKLIERLRERRQQGEGGGGEGGKGEFPLLKRILAKRREAEGGGAESSGQGAGQRQLSPENAEKLKERLQARKKKLDEKLAKVTDAVQGGGEAAAGESDPDHGEDQAEK